MFKKLILALAAAVALSACGGADAQTVVGTDGVKVLGGHGLLGVRHSPTEALYAGGGWQLITDDASKTKYGKLLAACGERCVTVDGDSRGLAMAVGDSNGVYCQSSSSVIAFGNVGQPVTIADGCAYWQKVKSVSQ